VRLAERRAGVLLPLFSLRSPRDWGVGDLGDLEPFCRWLASAGHGVLQLLPIAEMGPYETSPYGALTAFALDPLYLDLDAVEDFAAAGGVGALSPGARLALDAARGAPGIAYAHVRHAKNEALAAGFAHYEATEAATGSAREAAFAAFVEAERWWLESYMLFRALADLHGHQPWTTWEPAARAADQAALDALRPTLARACRYHAWVQWLLADQWTAARRAAAAAGVRLHGDMPFMVSHQSADVWARQREFRLDATIGAPPDAFSQDGQDWGLPVMRWEVMAENGYAWWRGRCRRAAALLDGIRLDHVIGYYRVYERPFDGTPVFHPADEGAQIVLGERLLAVGREAGESLELIGEDLGSVPDFVRQSLRRLQVPGFRVLRWEHDWGTFRDPRCYPELSVATTGTHDTSSLATWWEDELEPDTRAALAAVPVFAALREHGDRLTPAVQEVLLRGLYAAASQLVVVPFMDTYGGRERINVPSTVADSNWTYRMPWTVDELLGDQGAALAARLRDLAAGSGRLS
jgi:4-alpha-glucanotransferase